LILLHLIDLIAEIAIYQIWAGNSNRRGKMPETIALQRFPHK
jgi:hypothetical protein